MNILILHGSSDLYGASNVLLNVIKVLVGNGDKPIVALSETGPLVDKLQEQGIEVHIIKLGILRRKYFSLNGIIDRLLTLQKANKQLSKLIKQKDIQLVYSHTTAVLVGAIVARRLRLRHIWHVLEITTKPLFFVKMIGWILNRYSDTVITASDAVRNHWKQWVAPKKLRTIYNGLDCTPFNNKHGDLRTSLNIPDDYLLVGMIGRVHYWKGQDYFIKIAASLLKLNPKIHFVMVGDAFPGYEYLYTQNQKIIDHEGINDKIYNLGYREDIVNIVNSLDIFILPSTQPDPFPTVVLEAMAAGKAVAATNHGGAREMLIDGHSGLLIPINDAKEAAQILLPLADSSQERKRMGENAALRIKNEFSVQAFTLAITAVFTGRSEVEIKQKQASKSVDVVMQD